MEIITRDGYEFVRVEDDERMRWRGVPLRFCDVAFDDLDRGDEQLSKRIEWLESWDRTSLEWAVVIHGPRGSGKTTLAAAVMRRAVSNPSVRWIDWPSFLTTLADSWTSDVTEAELIGAATRADLLVLDDFGFEARNDNAREWQRRAAFEVIGKRYNAKRPTLITTELDAGGMADRIDRAVVSRLFEGTKWIDLSRVGDRRVWRRS